MEKANSQIELFSFLKKYSIQRFSIKIDKSKFITINNYYCIEIAPEEHLVLEISKSIKECAAITIEGYVNETGVHVDILSLHSPYNNEGIGRIEVYHYIPHLKDKLFFYNQEEFNQFCFEQKL